MPIAIPTGRYLASRRCAGSRPSPGPYAPQRPCSLTSSAIAIASATAHWNQLSVSNYAGFKPIGGLETGYNGTFDGGYKTISGLYIKNAGSRTGLFTILGS